MLCLNISDSTFITVKGVDYRFIPYGITKSEAIHLSQNSVLDNRGYI